MLSHPSDLHRPGCTSRSWTWKSKNIDAEKFKAWFECEQCGAKTVPVVTERLDLDKEYGDVKD